MPSPAIFLTDNGSLRPEATFELRRLARELSRVTGALIEPVSLLHSHKIDSDQLDGQPATIVKRRIREHIREGQHRFIVLPLFLGPSLAITDYLPTVVEELKQECAELRVTIADPLAGSAVESPDVRLAQILADHLRDLETGEGEIRFALVDHGTPIRSVNKLRNVVAEQVSGILGVAVHPCSMERREGPEYAFNDPLLENLDQALNVDRGKLLLAMFFLLPGRHAGPSGDVAEIADGLIAPGAFDSVVMSPLMAEHPLLLRVLIDRLREVL